MAVISKVSISNSALIKIGQERINTLDDGTKTANLCKDRIDYVIEEVLEEHPWNFALKRVSLDLLSEAPEYGFENAFQKPTDCLKIWKAEDDEIIFKVEDDKVLTDEPTFKCLYISRDVLPAKFSRLFADVVSLRLAAELAYAITGSREMQENMMKLYELRLRMAKSSDAQEGVPDDLIETTWTKERF